MTASTDTIPPPAPTDGGEAWLGSARRAGTQDGVFDDRGEVRPHWHAFLDSLKELGLAKLTHRWGEARLLIRENGVTYNVYGDPRGMERPWQLDPIPALIPPAEADVLEAGLVPRGRLFRDPLPRPYRPPA